MVDYQTTTDDGGDPAESLQEYKRHYDNVRELENLLAQVDGLADSMNAVYHAESEVGKVSLYMEFYDDD